MQPLKPPTPPISAPSKPIFHEYHRIENQSAFPLRKYYQAVTFQSNTICVGDDVSICVQDEDDTDGSWSFDNARITTLFLNESNNAMAAGYWYLNGTALTVTENPMFYRINEYKAPLNSIEKCKILISDRTLVFKVYIESIDHKISVFNDYNSYQQSMDLSKYFCDKVEYKDLFIHQVFEYDEFVHHYEKQSEYKSTKPIKNREINNKKRGTKRKYKPENQMLFNSLLMPPKSGRKRRKTNFDDDSIEQQDNSNNFQSNPKIQNRSKSSTKCNNIQSINDNDTNIDIDKDKDKISENNDNIDDNINSNNSKAKKSKRSTTKKSKKPTKKTINDSDDDYDPNPTEIGQIKSKSKKKKKNKHKSKKKKKKTKNKRKNKGNNNNKDKNGDSYNSETPQTKKQKECYIHSDDLNIIYQNNKVTEKDHIQTPVIILDYVQYLVENERGLGLGKGARFVDVAPLRCQYDNLDCSEWSTEVTVFLNPPFSRQNPKTWIKEAMKHIDKNKTSVIYLCKVNAMCQQYWFDEIYPNATKILPLQKNIKFVGYDKIAGFGCMLVIFDAKKKGEKYQMDHVDLLQWKQTMTKNQYKQLHRRMKQHMTLD